MNFKKELICLLSAITFFSFNLPIFINKDLDIVFSPLFSNSTAIDNNDETTDSDNDGIPDSWEINGYTVENGLIVKWDESKHGNKGFIKYTSDPYKSHTTGDPYSDMEKVLGKIDGGVLEEAQHPLIAAFPQIAVQMERLILSKNSNITDEHGNRVDDEKSQTVSMATTNSSSSSTTLGASAEVSYGPGGFGGSVSANFSHESSTSVAVDKGDSSMSGQTLGKSWSKSLNMNTADSAHINGNVRYYNYGTAPIYNVKPTLNFVLGHGKDATTLATIAAKSNTIANVLEPDKIYPEIKQNAIAWNSIDDFNSQPISINHEQLLKIAQGTSIQIQTTQTSGLFKKKNSEDNAEVNETQRWENVMSDIYGRTANITIALESNTKSRYISARKSKNYDMQTQPELTLKEAIELAFPGAKIDNKQNKISYKTMDEASTYLHFDENTSQEISKQMKQNKNTNFFDIKLKQGMKFLFVEKSDQTLLKNIKTLLGKYNTKNSFIVNSHEEPTTWHKILPLVQEQIDKNFNAQDLRRISKLKFFDNPTNEKPLERKTYEQVFLIDVGKIKASKIVMSFWNDFYDDQWILDKIAALLETYTFKLEDVGKVKFTYEQLAFLVEKRIAENIGTKFFKRLKIEHHWERQPILIRKIFKNLDTPWSKVQGPFSAFKGLWYYTGTVYLPMNISIGKLTKEVKYGYWREDIKASSKYN